MLLMHSIDINNSDPDTLNALNMINQLSGLDKNDLELCVGAASCREIYALNLFSARCRSYMKPEN